MLEKLKALLKREGTGISWCDLTFNPWIGCTKVSPACDHCYAEDLATARLGVTWGPGAPRRRTAPGNWAKPPRWNRIAEAAGVRIKVFCASLADVLDNEVEDEWRADLAALIIATPWLDWMMLTKRVGNARKMLAAMFPDGVPPNVALGVTIANQEEADRDLPKALSVKQGLGIRRLFLSMEPLLSRVDISRYLATGLIDLVIVGGESGTGARIMHPGWVRFLRDQCAYREVPFHFKQWGEYKPWVEGERGDVFWFDPNGHVYGGPTDWPPKEDEPRAAMWRATTRRAGHILDGREHREHFYV